MVVLKYLKYNFVSNLGINPYIVHSGSSFLGWNYVLDKKELPYSNPEEIPVVSYSHE